MASDLEVRLPFTVSKEALLLDLEYYDFEDVDPISIDGSCASLEAAAHMASCEFRCKNEIEEYKDAIRKLETKKNYVVFAHQCFTRYSQNGSLTGLTFDPDWESVQKGEKKPSEKHVMYKQAFTALNYLDTEFLDQCLAKYGLRYKTHEMKRLSNRAQRCVVELGRRSEKR